MTSNLPAQLTSFIGRDREVTEVVRLLNRARLVTITGPGGVGKTRLAIEAARKADAAFVSFVELAPLRDGALVPSAIAAALGIAEVRGEPLLDTVLHALQATRALLVLDNCEHLIDDCATTVLSTSREPLKIPGEVVRRVPPLSTREAAALFFDRAGAAEADFRETPEHSHAVDQICEKLDGLPLAIELSAACVGALTVTEIASRLHQRFKLLSANHRTAPSRHQTLDAMVDWSYELLSPAEQQLYRRLSVFSGSCSLEAVEAICVDERAPEGSVLPVLRRLVEKSLVLAEPEGDATRYRMLETLRQHSAEKLGEAGEEASLCDRHLCWFLELAERGEREPYGADAVAWVALIQRELENFRAALGWACKNSAQHEAGLRLAAALGRYLWWSALANEARNWLQALLAGAPRTAGRARALACAVFLCMRQGDPGAAEPLAEEEVSLARELGDLADARSMLVEALALARKQHDQLHIVYLLRSLGSLRLELGELEVARQCLEECLSTTTTDHEI